MIEQYLIAHKVRGEPALDIAEPMQVEDEIFWIIPTSGHRAYPYWYRGLHELELNGYPTTTVIELFQQDAGDMPADLPEHYEVSAAPKGTGLKDGRSILQRLGLLKPAEPMTRRDW